ncbi:MAG TPA: hypothetical protein VKY89_02700 [Thermoanaerobaculia bacterium]|nr:hypothetical protein [Thermoanaerobaculia bacterium]
MRVKRIAAAVLGGALAAGGGLVVGAAATDPGAARGGGSTPPPAPSWQEVQLAAKAAHDAGHFEEYRGDIQRLVEILSGNPATVFAMAKAEALLGHPAAALEWLNAYAAMGLLRDAGAEPDLASLREVDGFAAALARLDANRRPVSRSSPVFTLPERELLTEDIAYDPGSRRFFVSSIRERKIVAIDARSGAAADFVPAGRDRIWGVMALAVDARRGVLWATTAAMPQTRGYRADDQGHTAVLRYDLATGKLLKRYDLPLARPVHPASPGSAAARAPVPAEDRDRVLGDMTVAPDGDVFASEAVTGAVYTVRRDRDELELLVPPGTFISPQTPAATPDGRRLLVADYVRGIGIVDLATRAVTWMPHPREVAVNGIDGMYLFGGSLLAIQNGTDPNRVVRLRLDPALTRIAGWEAIESNSPGLGQPTHGTVVGTDFFFLANSGWDQFADDGSVKPGASFTPAQVRRVAL